MKKTIFLAVLLMSFTAAAPLFADDNEKGQPGHVAPQKEQEEPFAVYKFPAAAIEKVTVSAAGGSIRLSGDAGDEAVVEVRIRPSSGRKKMPKEDIQKILDENYTLEVKVERGELRVKAERKSGAKGLFKTGLGISFHLRVLQKAASRLSTSGGSIRIQHLAGEEILTTSGGSLHVDDVSGTVTGSTSGGSIHLSESKGEIKLTTSGGSIHAGHSEGNIFLATSGGSIRLNGLGGNIYAATSGGSIRLADIFGTVKASTSGGSFHADKVSGTFTAGTSGGSMHLTDISGNLYATTSGGSMNVRMTLVGDSVRLFNSGSISLTVPGGKGYNLQIQGSKIETGAVKNFQGVFESNRINGTLNGGGAEIYVKSSQRVRLRMEE
ncbi:MAG: hypothetical protein LBN98_05345 [Prevotellaceae bacterium]|nr:hypothetical protein [Prevotellaceae bacterium]